jgi:S-adenosylmethionine decarboxylase
MFVRFIFFMHTYSPGLHILSEIKTTQEIVFKEMLGAKSFFNVQIEKFGLTKVGEVYHQFDNSGFTASICLTESHISIHTWPEFGYATFDIYLSNYQKDNHDITRQIHVAVLDFFQASSHHSKEIYR